MKPITIHVAAARLQWDRENSVLWVCLQLVDGQRYRIGLPVSYFADVFCAWLKRLGVKVEPWVGEDLSSVDGLFGFIKRTA